MIHSAHHNIDDAKVAELKRLITSRQFDSVEMLEDAVDHLLWGEEPNVEAAATTCPSTACPSNAPAVLSETAKADA